MTATRPVATLVLTAALLVGGVACGGSDDDAATTTTTEATEAKVEVNLDDSDNPTVEYTDEDGTTTEFGSSLPDGWPEALTPPTTITIVSSSTSEEDGGTQLFVTGESTEAFDAVYRGIKDQLKGAGFEITSDLSTDEGDFAGLEASKGEVTANITVAGDATAKKVTVLYTVAPEA